jgi:hypothetical protein
MKRTSCRKFGLVPIALCASLVVVLGSPAWANPPTTADDIRYISDGKSSATAFENSASLQDLRAAIASLSRVGIDLSAPANNLTTRRELVSAWAAVFKEIDRSYERSSNTADFGSVPSLHSDAQAGGPANRPNDTTGSGPGVQFQTALQTDNQESKRDSFQLGLRNLDAMAQQSMRSEIVNFRSATPADTATLSSIVKGAGLTAARMQQLTAML